VSAFDAAFLSAWYPSGKAAFGASVTYTRGAASVVVEALMDTVEEITQRDDGVIVRSDQAIFEIVAADLILSGSAATPTRGDTITTDAAEVYEVMQDGETEFEQAINGNVWRVAAKLVRA